MTFTPQFVAVDVRRGFSQEGLLRRDRKNRTARSQNLQDSLIEMLGDNLDLVRVPQICLLDHEHDILFPLLPDQSQKIPRRGRPRIRDRKNKHDQIGHWNKIFGNFLVIRDDRICPGGIDDVEIF